MTPGSPYRPPPEVEAFSGLERWRDCVTLGGWVAQLRYIDSLQKQPNPYGASVGLDCAYSVVPIEGRPERRLRRSRLCQGLCDQNESSRIDSPCLRRKVASGFGSRSN
jgi:hypothetical protein